MVIRLEVYENDEWGVLNTRQTGNDAIEIEKVCAALYALQSTWATNYDRFKGARFRIMKSH